MNEVSASMQINNRRRKEEVHGWNVQVTEPIFLQHSATAVSAKAVSLKASTACAQVHRSTKHAAADMT